MTKKKKHLIAKTAKPGQIAARDIEHIKVSMKDCPVCHSALPQYVPTAGNTIECEVCFADMTVSDDAASLKFIKFGGKAFGQL